MRTLWNWLQWILVSLGIFAFILITGPTSAQAKSVNEKILDILLESKIVTQEKYQELKKEVEAEEAEVAKFRAAAEKKPIEGAKIDFKRGFSIESLDGENKLEVVRAASGRL